MNRVPGNRPPGCCFPGDWGECNTPNPLPNSKRPTSRKEQLMGVVFGLSIFGVLALIGFLGWLETKTHLGIVIIVFCVLFLATIVWFKFIVYLMRKYQDESCIGRL